MKKQHDDITGTFYYTPPNANTGIFHDAMSGVFEAGSRGLPLVTRIHRIVKALFAYRKELGEKVSNLQDISAQFKRLLPVGFHNESLPKQAEILVDRLADVQHNLGVVEGLNKAQMQRLERCNARDKSLIDQNAKIWQELYNGEAAMTKATGVDSTTKGDFSERIRTHMQNLVTAFQANQAFAAQAGMPVCSNEREQWSRQNDSLRQENNRLRDSLAIYKSSVDHAHARLSELGVEKGGDVTLRINKLVVAVKRSIVKSLYSLIKE
jgi:chromosome segregation ATPase